MFFQFELGPMRLDLSLFPCCADNGTPRGMNPRGALFSVRPKAALDRLNGKRSKSHFTVELDRICGINLPNANNNHWYLMWDRSTVKVFWD